MKHSETTDAGVNELIEHKLESVLEIMNDHNIPVGANEDTRLRPLTHKWPPSMPSTVDRPLPEYIHDALSDGTEVLD